MESSVRNSHVLSIDDLDQLRDVVRGADVEFTQLVPGGLRATLLRLDLGGFWYDYHYASLPLRGKGGVSPETLSFALPELPTTFNGCRVEPGQLFVFAPGGSYEGQHCADIRDHLLTVGLAALEEFAEQQGIRVDVESLRGNAALRCPPAAVEPLSRFCRMLRDGVSRGEIVPGPAAAGRLMQEAVLANLCRALAGVRPGEPERGAASYRQHCRVVGAVEEYLSADGPEAPSINDLCVATGLPARTLTYAFQQAMGISPRRYLHIRRLLAVRQALRSAARAEADVTRIAMEHGFWHLGRFSQYYKEFFGELPSETRRGGNRTR